MMQQFRVIAVAVGLLLSGTFAFAEDAGMSSPVAVVEQTAAELQRSLNGRQDYYAQNASELYALIDKILLPSFDVEYAGKMVLGKTHWRAASAAQRDRFIEAFYDFLIKTYAKGILEFDQENLVVVPEARFSKDGRKAMVMTELLVKSDDDVRINYAVRQSDERWKIYDVRIDGVSYIQNYRNQFDAEISAQGIDAVIERLESEADKEAGQPLLETEAT